MFLRLRSTGFNEMVCKPLKSFARHSYVYSIIQREHKSIIGVKNDTFSNFFTLSGRRNEEGAMPIPLTEYLRT